MTQAFFAFLTAITMLFTPFFGCGQTAAMPDGLAAESEPAKDGFSFNEKVIGVKNSIFYIKRPDKNSYNTVSASAFGISPDNRDNSDAFRAAIEFCRNNPHTRLVFDNGTYFFRNESEIVINDLKDTIIDGKGSDFCFSNAYYFSISDCERLEFTDFSIIRNDENGQLASLVKISNASSESHSFDMEFIGLDNANEDTVISALTQYDPETLTPGVRKGTKEHYIYSSPESIVSVKKVSNNTLRLVHDGSLDDICNDEIYLLRHHVYGGNVFNVFRSNNFTFSNIRIGTAAGMGWLISDRCSHFQIIDCSVDIPDGELSERVSTTADAIHIANTNGHFKIDGCTFGFMGDDALNVHDNVSLVTGIPNKKNVTLYSNAPNIKVGDTVSFYDERYNKTGVTAQVQSVDGNIISLDTDISSSVKNGFIVTNDSIDSGNYVITNNRIHENRARGFLLQSSNGLCSDNVFYKTMGNAIKVVVDISSGNWLEGTGVNLLEISGNTFTDCNVSDWGTQIDISTNINGESASRALFENITISNNSFDGGYGEMLSASNVNGLVITGNTVRNIPTRIILGMHCGNVSVKENSAPDSAVDFTIKIKSISALF